jgi:Ca2+-binding EF-hand superfamily protein
VCKQIRNALLTQRIANREAFNRFDSNGDGFLSFSEFSEGISSILALSMPIQEKLFALMDKQGIGLVDYPNFLEVIQISSASTASKGGVEDNFNWEQGIIQKIQKWIKDERITAEEAFKCMDKDFDGIINKEDLKQSLLSIFNVKADKIIPTKLDRLFRLMDFYKVGGVQLQDIQRMVSDENPYISETAGKSATNFNKSFGGGIKQASTFDWKLSAIQQIGLMISKQFPSI